MKSLKRLVCLSVVVMQLFVFSGLFLTGEVNNYKYIKSNTSSQLWAENETDRGWH